jgi:octaprenyl-diphosphate synthase
VSTAPKHATAELRRSYGLIADKMARVETELSHLCESDVKTIEKIGDYLRTGGGKRVRPALLLLSAKLLGYGGGDRDIRYAAVVEFIHAATLVHDDIIDEARLRRGRESVNARWGNNLTVLFGDYLYTKSMGVALEEGSLPILKILSDATLAMIEGEIISLETEGNVHMPEETALEIIRRKTAELFAAACRIPAHFAPLGGERASQLLGQYGRTLGISFQLVDDTLDYTSSESALGKPVLSDLREGKLTMPLIFALKNATGEEKRKVARVLEERRFESVSPFEILAIVNRYDGIEKTRSRARDHARAALEPLTELPAGEPRDVMAQVAEALTERAS